MALARSVASDVTYKTLAADVRTLAPTIFESSVVHDLMVLVSALCGEVRHYRDSHGKEIDAILTLPDGRWGAVEIKLGGAQMLAGVESLRTSVDQIDTEAVGEPAFRLVVTGIGPILTADNGTVISPLAALQPWPRHLGHGFAESEGRRVSSEVILLGTLEARPDLFLRFGDTGPGGALDGLTRL